MKQKSDVRVSIILATGMILALLLSACGGSATPAPTQDVAMIQTEAAQTVIAEITQSAPAPTVVPAPTATPELPPGDPALELGPPDAIDTFDAAINFAPMSNNCFTSEITGGQFVMAAKGLQGLYCWTTSWATLQDFYMQTTTIMPDACDSRDNFGLLVRSPNSNSGYLFGLNCGGQYSLRRMSNGSVTDLIPPTGSEAIQIGAGQVNRLGIAAYGGNFHLFANGKYLSSVTDFTYVQPGDFGYFVNAATTVPFVTRYDDLMVWALNDAYYPSSAPPPTAPVVEPSPPPSGVPFVTATTGVNIRSGPGTNYPVYGVAPTGASAPVTGISPDGGWYYITIPTTYSPDGTAWVSADYVTLTGTTPAELPVVQPPPPPPEVSTLPAEPSSSTMVTTEPVNVRSGPGNEYSSYGVVPIGTPVQPTGVSDDGKWVSVAVPTAIAPDGIGWINAAYLQPY